LHSREERSAAIVRAATAAQLVANHAIRAEFTARIQFDAELINGLLKWANGPSGEVADRPRLHDRTPRLLPRTQVQIRTKASFGITGLIEKPVRQLSFSHDLLLTQVPLVVLHSKPPGLHLVLMDFI